MDFVSQEQGEMTMLYDLFFAFLQTKLQRGQEDHWYDVNYSILIVQLFRLLIRICFKILTFNYTLFLIHVNIIQSQ